MPTLRARLHAIFGKSFSGGNRQYHVFIYEPVGPHECEVFPYGVVSFFPTEPLDHTIEGGEFVTLCVSPEHYWFDVFLHTHSPGSLTVEIPKDAVDLKQFDFPRCLSPGHVFVRDDYYTPPGSVTISQVSQTEYSRTLWIVWDYPGVEKISYAGSDLDVCISKHIEGTYDPSEYTMHENYAIKTAESVCNGRHHIKMNFAHNITTGSVEMMCLNKEALEIILDVEEDGHLLLDIPNGLFSKAGLNILVNVGDNEHFDDELYRLLARDPRLEHYIGIPDAPIANYSYAIITSYPRLFYSAVMDYYGHTSASQIDIVVHSINADSITYRIPFLKDDAAFVLSDDSIFVQSSSEYYERDPSQLKRMIEKYAVPSELPPPRVQARITSPLDIVCRDSLVQVIKNPTFRVIETGNGILRQLGMPTAICIKPSSVDVFMERGLIVLPDEMGGLASTEDGSSTQAWMNGSDSRSKQW